MRYLIFIGLLVSFFAMSNTSLFAKKNQEVDSLKSLLKTVKDTTRVNVLTKLCWKLRNSETNQSLEYGQEAIKLAKKINFEVGLMTAYSFVGVAYRNLGNYSEAFENYYQGLVLSQKLHDKEKEGFAYNNIGNLYIYQEKYNDALENLNHSLVIAKAIKHQVISAYAQLNIGRIYLFNKKYGVGRVFIENALNIRSEMNDQSGVGVCLKYLGDIYNETGDFTTAMDYYKKTMEISGVFKDDDLIADMYHKISMGLIKQKKFAEADAYIQKSMQLATKIKSKFRIRNAYQALVEISKNTGNYKKAFEYQELTNRYNDSLFNQKIAERIADIQFSQEKQKKQTEIDLLNKDKKIKDLAMNRQRMGIIAMVVFIFLGLLVVVLLIRTNIHRKKVNRVLRSQKEMIDQKNVELNQQNEEIAAQRDNLETANHKLQQQKEEITSQRDELEVQSKILMRQGDRIQRQNDEIKKQRDLVMHQKKEITDSIHYAQRIQKAVMPNEEELARMVSEYFILYRPKDIVSGDFYWFTVKNTYLMTAVADCTGHGVPGAFMSMLGISFLNEITNRLSYPRANVVLDALRENIKTSLHQKGKSGEQKDGMDMVLICIDTVRKTDKEWVVSDKWTGVSDDTLYYSLYYAGANNPIWIIRDSGLPMIKVTAEGVETLEPNMQGEGNVALYEIKPDKMPIAIYEDMRPFTNHEIRIKKGDRIYMFTDGYEDQFGGPKANEGGKKFKAKQLKEILLANCTQSMPEQKCMVENALVNWMGQLEQVDDVTLMGLKF